MVKILSIFVAFLENTNLTVKHFFRVLPINHFKGLCYELFALIIPARPRVDLPCSEWPPGPSPLACQKCPSIHKTLQFPVDLLRSHAEHNLRLLELIRLTKWWLKMYPRLACWIIKIQSLFLYNRDYTIWFESKKFENSSF